MQLAERAAVIRSKNAGPFVLTIDVFFDDDEGYARAKASPVLTREGVAEVYGVGEHSVTGVYWNDTVRGIKISMLRWKSASDPYCSDIFGAHLHTPLAVCEIG
jgi:hypothetical protein